MPQSLSKIYLHITFSTKNRLPVIHPEIETELFSYMAGILKNMNCTAVIINGIPDHVHILNILSRTIAVSDMIKNLKKDSSGWLKTKGLQYRDFRWQDGYGVFSINYNRVETVRHYIQNQKQHHSRVSFKHEFLFLLQKSHVEYDETYLWN